MNPANEIKEKASKMKLTYWEYLSKKGRVHEIIHEELQETEDYVKKCKERRKGK